MSTDTTPLPAPLPQPLPANGTRCAPLGDELAPTEAVLETPVEALAEVPVAVRTWEDLARCRDLPTGLFFSDDLDDIAVAKGHCLACPVRTECLDAAVERHEQFGIWGGHLFVAGRIVLRKRRRGRPPKVPRPGDTLPEVEVPVAYRRLVSA